MLCPNCMSPYVEPLPEEEAKEHGEEFEQLMRCTQCEYTAPKSEFLPEDYR